jgi:hypothetical protein
MQPFTWVFEEDILNESLSQLWGLLEEEYPERLKDVLGILTPLSANELPYRSGDGRQTILVSVSPSDFYSQNTSTSLWTTLWWRPK